MPDWLAAVTGWICLLMGCLGLWRGIDLLLPRRTETHDSNGMPGTLVVVESIGLTLLSGALLLGGHWAYLAPPAVVLMVVSAALHAIGRWRCRRSCCSPPARKEELSDA